MTCAKGDLSREDDVHLRPIAVLVIVALAGVGAVVHAVGLRTTLPPSFVVANGEASPIASVPIVSRAGPRGATERPTRRIVVYVAGRVVRPGIYYLADAARVDDALRAAGGPTADADAVAVNLAARVEDGEEIAVPPRGAVEPAVLSTDTLASTPATATSRSPRRVRHRRRKRVRRHAVSSAPTASDVAAEDVMGAPVDVNAADASTLASLPGIGPGLAGRIVAFRTANGSFASADELLDVGGMTQRKVDALAPYATFGNVPSRDEKGAP